MTLSMTEEKPFSLLVMIFSLSVLALVACSREKNPQSPPNSFMMVENSICANPSIIAVDLIDNTPSKIRIDGSEIDLRKDTHLIYHVFVPTQGVVPSSEVIVKSTLNPSPQCWDRSIYQFFTKPIKANWDEQFNYSVKFVELDEVNKSPDYRCSLEKVFNQTTGDINYKLCRYTHKKILSEGLRVTPFKLCNIIEILDCNRRILSERRRIVDLQALNLLQDVEAFDGEVLMQKLEISSVDIDLFKRLLVSAINEKHINPDRPVEPDRYTLFDRKTAKQKTDEALEEILLVSLEAQQAVFEAFNNK